MRRVKYMGFSFHNFKATNKLQNTPFEYYEDCDDDRLGCNGVLGGIQPLFKIPFQVLVWFGQLGGTLLVRVWCRFIVLKRLFHTVGTGSTQIKVSPTRPDLFWVITLFAWHSASLSADVHFQLQQPIGPHPCICSDRNQLTIVFCSQRWFAERGSLRLLF